MVVIIGLHDIPHESRVGVIMVELKVQVYMGMQKFTYEVPVCSERKNPFVSFLDHTFTLLMLLIR